MKTTHSDKATKTLELMNTTGADWAHPEVKWVLEEKELALREICPDCRGWRYLSDPVTYRRTNERCPRCIDSTGRASTCLVTRVRKVWVGYIQWPTGTRFGLSRFGSGGNSAHQCELCGKGINKSGRVPLITTKDGQARAMFVGEDCARKFTNVLRAKPEQAAKGANVILADNFV